MKYLFLFMSFFIFPFYSVKVSMSKICVRCKYFIRDDENNILGKCALFPTDKGIIEYLVTGVNKNKYQYCCTSREFDNMCGKEGRLYEEKTHNKTLK